MRKKTLYRILYVTIILAITSIFVLNLCGINIFNKTGYSKIPSLLTGIVVFWTFYFTIGWKLPLIKKIVYKENLNGTWFGTYTSKNFTSNEEFNGEIAVVIRQDFLSLDVKSFTEKYINHSFGEALTYNSKSESHQLIYLYSQSEFNPTDDNMRKGTSELNLHFDTDEDKLYGNFWTNHNSKGYINLKKVSKKHSTSFTSAAKYHTR